jgi:hypothetical protein
MSLPDIFYERAANAKSGPKDETPIDVILERLENDPVPEKLPGESGQEYLDKINAYAVKYL